MKKIMVAVLVAGMAAAVMAGQGKTYQVTGPVLELTDAKIIVEKGKEKWEISRTPQTKVSGDLKIGAKVTIEYTMTATSVEVKEAKSAADVKAKESK